MKILTEQNNQDETCFYISGEFDALGCKHTKHLWDVVNHNEHTKHITLDLTEVTFLDSTGVGAIVFLFKKLRDQQTVLSIKGAIGQPKELLTLLRIDQAIQMH